MEACSGRIARGSSGCSAGALSFQLTVPKPRGSPDGELFTWGQAIEVALVPILVVTAVYSFAETAWHQNQNSNAFCGSELVSWKPLTRHADGASKPSRWSLTPHSAFSKPPRN
jgi:hypothetical protein